MKTATLLSAFALIPPAFAVTVSFDNTYDNGSNPLANVACSDGANGLITRYGFQTFSDIPDFPHIGGASVIPGWNSPNCGTCWQLTYSGTRNTINVLAVDHADDGFNLSQEALDELTNEQATQLGRIDATAVQVDVGQCGLSH
ncbi:SnodProt1 [Punctularia strigosozonata HHB-11173 SS5]|uniref:SnodProt1 n=1 Tax=Punctularia strigosozonata (strain HHB-11173) TaxID=741275 RepID=UPI0004416885|nr:SnodProt1 [Punctularia strigosozonata HHB-11173 SS5]EIN07920.1 SnodProt1 [Punctularia strigosozonata HHB-11173 SS5]